VVLIVDLLGLVFPPEGSVGAASKGVTHDFLELHINKLFCGIPEAFFWHSDKDRMKEVYLDA
jgi:hypothetical protein